MKENNYNNKTNEKKTSNKIYKLPKNIRQIGQAGGNKKIYIEDYVMNYVKQLALKEYGKFVCAVLIGNYAKIDGIRNIFIKGALEVINDAKDNMLSEEITMKDADVMNDYYPTMETNPSKSTYLSRAVFEPNNPITISNEAWTSIYENIKKYFTDSEIVGWYIGGAGLSLEVDDKVLKAHIDNFSGQDKILFMYDSADQEEVFFIGENNHLKKQHGYYIYYERNEEMQNYMIDHKVRASEEVQYEDQVTKDIRKVLADKKTNVENKHIVPVLYGACTILTIVVLVIAATMLHNYNQIDNMKEALHVLSENLAVGIDKSKEKDMNNIEDKAMTNNQTEEGESEEEQTKVETMAGNIKSIKEETIIGDNKQSTKGNNKLDQTDTKSEQTNDSKKEEESSDSKTSKGTDEKVNTVDTTKQTSSTTDSEATTSNSKDENNKVEKTTAKPNYYTIQKGDTLATISIKYYHSIAYVDKILEANNIENQDKIIEGEKIILP